MSAFKVRKFCKNYTYRKGQQEEILRDWESKDVRMPDAERQIGLSGGSAS